MWFSFDWAGEGGRDQTEHGGNCANLICNKSSAGRPGRPGCADGPDFSVLFLILLVGWSVGFGRCCEWIVNIHT